MSGTERTTVLISGGGPAGIVLGLLLGRAGIAVTVLEKHADFLRDFRGDTVHASTMRLIDDLGLAERFRRLPQGRLGNLELPDRDGSMVTIADFNRLPEPYNYVGMVPQWNLLNLLAEEAAKEPSFTLRMEAESLSLLQEGGRVAGVRYRSNRDGTEREVRADLTVVCEGRSSRLRQELDLPEVAYRVPFDAWWFRLPRCPEDQDEVRIAPLIRGSEVLLTLHREDYFQLAYLAPKGSDARLRGEGVESFRRRISALCPAFADRVDSITTMDQVHMLDVRLNLLRRWYADAALCIGDAAHAMTPVGGVGINLAVQDAVAAARILEPALQRGTVAADDLAQVQKRRMLPTRVVQTAQRAVNRAVLQPTFEGRRSGAPAPLVAVLRGVPVLSALPARLVSHGIRPEPTPAFARRAASG
ncbi:FAD-dependent oxidoreductase [Nesterenkonia ebinurensis]|uniref:FAD-dependent oxidoreductase n=1 Tax=Nesterenkonia ebinurensis TaxID=2608252 RepID=UPI00123DB4CD|nr:FAD-dependent oxidoreductase [Nesterenkonia ebinurensis]